MDLNFDVLNVQVLPTTAAEPATPLRRRAKTVCQRCHEKKIKCDFVSKPSQSETPCGNCTQSSSECRLRLSRRNMTRRRQPKPGHDRQGSISHIRTPPPSTDKTAHQEHPVLTSPRPQCLSPSDTVLDSSSTDQARRRDSQASDLLAISRHTLAAQQQAPLFSHREGTNTTQSVIDSRDARNEEELPNQDYEPAQCAQASYLGDSGYMPVLSQLRRPSSSLPNVGPITIELRYTIDPLPLALRSSYLDTFLDNCYSFCPILDKASLDVPEIGGSLLLQQALALVGSVIQPSLLHEEVPSSYYEMAKVLLQGGHETNPLASLLAVMLFYWFSPCPPNIVSMNGSWWWGGTAIRLAQELGFHREQRAGQALRAGEYVGLRRRIWWTLFARERLTAICQGRPCIINPQDCDVREPSREDFPNPSDGRVEIFVQWVRLCGIVGQVGDHLRRSPSVSVFAEDLLNELRKWAHSLPISLRLPFSAYPTEHFDRDVYLLHLPYLSCITLLHLKKSTRCVPMAYPTAILSASCVARIFEDFLLRGSLRFLQGMAGWHIAIALLALLDARQVKSLEQGANAHIRVLRVALKEMARRWDSAKLYDKGIEQLLAMQHHPQPEGEVQTEKSQGLPNSRSSPNLSGASETMPGEGLEGVKYFPGTTKDTSPLFEILLSSSEPTPFSELENANDLSVLLYNLFDNPLDGLNYDPAEHLTGWGMSMHERIFQDLGI